MDAIEHYDAVDVFIGVDVGKGEHLAVALTQYSCLWYGQERRY
ncbi:hypothetical protein [Duganella guangzhouensis]|nr:hypothetical protein [Duganella guangzhouensis]